MKNVTMREQWPQGQWDWTPKGGPDPKEGIKKRRGEQCSTHQKGEKGWREKKKQKGSKGPNNLKKAKKILRISGRAVKSSRL